MWGAVVGAVVAAVGGAIGIAAGLYVYDGYASDFVPPDQVAVNTPYDGAKIYDRNGEFLYELVDELNGLRRPVEFDQISPNMIAATVATEDSSFFENSGINVRGLVRAAFENLNPFGQKDILEGSGGSSISQQLAKNLYIPEDERSARSIDRKIKEAVFAIELTRQYSKEQILTWYLNQINYGGIYYGVEAASEGYFNKPASELTLAEAATLAGIPQSPSAYDPSTNPAAAKARRNQVLDLIREKGAVPIGNGRTLAFTNAQIDAAQAEDINLVESQDTLTAPQFVFDQVIPQLDSIVGHDALLQDGLKVTTSIDMNLQRQSQALMENWIVQYEDSSNSHNGAIIIVDPKTGELLTYAGSRDYYREDIQGKNDNLIALNSPGSSFKPFVYLTSFLELGWSPGTVIMDEDTKFTEDDGTVFQPKNPVPHTGPITLRDALGNSLNVPPFRVAMAVGVDKIVQHAQSWGFDTLTGDYGPSIALGGVDLTAVDLAYGYAMLANGGVMRGVQLSPDSNEIGPVSVLKVYDRSGNQIYDSKDHLVEKRMVDEQHAYMITSILTDGQAECITFGCGGIRVPGLNVAVKTGTSEPYAPDGPDAGKIGETWAFGYTPDYVVGIWAGNSDNSPVQNIYSTTISFHSMSDIIRAAYNGRPQTPFQQPDGLGLSASCQKTSIAIGCKRDLVLTDDKGKPVASANGDDSGKPPANATNDATKDDANPGNEPKDATPTPGPSRSHSSSSAGGSITAIIASPGGGPVSGTVGISGVVSSPSLQSFSVDVTGPGGTSHSIASGSQARTGILGAWSTAGVPPGTYTITLTVTDSQLGSSTSSVTVTVQ